MSNLESTPYSPRHTLRLNASDTEWTDVSTPSKAELSQKISQGIAEQRLNRSDLPPELEAIYRLATGDQ